MYEISTLDWFDVPLVYSDHAIQRAEERDMKIYSYLPVTSELVKSKDDGSCTFKFIEGDMYIVIVVIKGGRVLTSYPAGYVFPKVKAKKVKAKKASEEEKVEVAEGLLDFLKKKKVEAPKKPSGPKLLGVDFDGNYIYDDDIKEVKSELKEAYNAINTIKSELSEVNLFNAKLLYTNKIFKAKNLTESQKVKVLTSFDKTTSIKEAKLVYETLLEGLKTPKPFVNESMLRNSASRATGIIDKKPILEVNNQFSRWQILAGIKKN